MKTKILRTGAVVFALGVILYTQGCGPTLGHVYTKVEDMPANKAVVYVYRPSSFFGGGVVYDVKANGKEVVTTLYNGGYYPYVTEPREIEFSAKTESRDAVTIDVKPGQTYFLKGTVGVGFVVGRPHLTVVPPNVAENEIAECKLIPEP